MATVLNYNTLDEIVDPRRETSLAIVNVDVKRMHGDNGPIEPGADVVFVATFSLAITKQFVNALRGIGLRHALKGDPLLVVAADGELRSEKVEIDEDSVALWLADNYDFEFVLNGAAPPGAFRPAANVNVKVDGDRRTSLALPWVAALNTVAVRGDFVDVDVRITERPYTPRAASVSFASYAPSWRVEAEPGHTPTEKELREARFELRSTDDKFRAVLQFAPPPTASADVYVLAAQTKKI